MDKGNIVAALTRSPLFEGIEESEISAMLKCSDAKFKDFSVGDTVCRFDSDKQCIGVIIKGEAELERIDYDGNRTVLEMIGEGDMFGQTLAFTNLTGDMLAVVCRKSALVVFIPADFVSCRCAHYCNKHNVLVRNMLSIISSKARSLSERVEVLSNRSIRDKLLNYFAIGCAKSGGNTFTLPFSLSTLADYICCDRSAMMRELASMKSEGIVGVDKREVVMRR
ncbi:MAG: Crp/Fnr family transcriptional regulator [Clostridia bacterium]|nr:Crp/Fnr family transcriptional regulator [Clostridia bacterium]